MSCGGVSSGGVSLPAASGEARLTFGHANANCSMFNDCIKNQFLKE